MASCAPSPMPPRAVVALDEAFASARPGLADRLEKGPILGGSVVSRVPMAEGAGRALDTARAEAKRSGKPVALVTSPLLAKAILASGSWGGDPFLLVPELRGEAVSGPARPGLWTAVTDPLPAYGSAGEASGAFIAALSVEGGSPSCGILFSEAPSRPRAALTAFAAAYAEASEGRPLYVRELGEPGSPGDSASADAAAKELLGSDIRVLFIALGASSGAAIRAAARPGLVLGADFPAPESPSSLAFRVVPDDEGLAKALDSSRRGLGGTALGAAGGSTAVSALLLPGPPASVARIGRLDFAAFLSAAAPLGVPGGKTGLEGAALRAKASR